MNRVIYILILILACAFSVSATTFYALPTGSGTACTSGSPCLLSYGLTIAGPVESGDTLCISKGSNVTHSGKYVSELTGATVRSCDTNGNPVYDWRTAGWATIDGYRTTTLNGAILSTGCSIAFTSASDMTVPLDVMIDSEYIRVYSFSGNNVTSCDRAFGGTANASHSNGATITVRGNNFQATGDDSIYRDFEVTSSYTVRDTGADWSASADSFIRGSGIYPSGTSTGNKFINLLVSNNLDGMSANPSTTNSELYGNLTYNNGVHYSSAPEQGAGNGFYGGNASGFFKFYNNVSLNNFNFNGQFGDMAGGDFQRNIFANAGSPLGGLRGDVEAGNFNVLYHHEETDTNMSVTDSHHWMSYDNTNLAAWFGYGGLLTNLTATGNYFVGGDIIVKLAGNGTNITTVVSFSNNQFYGPGSSTFVNKFASFAVTTWDNNTYHNAGSVFDYNSGGNTNFATWKTNTGFDAASTATGSAMPDTVVVIPNTYQTGRANIVIYGVSSPTSINVNLATTGLTNGQGYTIVNAFDPKDTAVATGTYNSGSTTISVPLNGAATNVETPVGMGFTPATTCPKFCVMVVVPGAITEEQNTVRLVWTRIAAIIPPFFIIAAAVLAIAFGVVGLVFFIDRRQQARRFAAHAQPKYITAPVDSFINDFHRDFDKARRKK